MNKATEADSCSALETPEAQSANFQFRQFPK